MRAPASLAAAALALLASLALSGCFGSDEPTLLVTPYSGVNLGEPGRLTQFALYVENRGEFREDVKAEVLGVPPNWTVKLSETDLRLRGERTGRTLLMDVTPAANASLGQHWLTVRVGDAETRVGLRLIEMQGPEADRGVGARVRTVGFFDNGTVFYHNMVEVRDNGALPKPGIPADPDVDPLKVYVGGTRRTPPPEPYASAGYSPVIPGFDEALYNLRAGDTRVVHVPPEAAYTQPGNENHRLYGAALNFLIVVESVDVQPNDAPGAQCPLPVCPV